MQYEIVSKLGGDDQVGLRLKCDSQLQAEKIHRALRQEGFWVSRLMPNNLNSLNYTHFVYRHSHRNSTPRGNAKN
jgi:hypothetical protein